MLPLISTQDRDDLDRSLALYLHWPFCKAKCPYCDFNSHVRHGGVDEESFAKAYALELDWVKERVPEAKITSIFFGGGTPSLLSAQTVGGLLEKIAQCWPLSESCEVTLEANPTSVEAARFAGYRASGVNRLSLGVQSLREDALKALGRQHTVAEALEALSLALRFFPRVSFDLIYARPHQTLKDWEEELTQALSFEAGHLSLYQLTIEPETPYAALHHKGQLPMPGEALSSDFYTLTQEKTEKKGLHAYEVSNYARPGQESRHNLTYWRYGMYAGIGPGAHGRLAFDGHVFALCTEKHPETWRDLVREKGGAWVECEPISPQNQALEKILMGLRLQEGVSIDVFIQAGIPNDRLNWLVSEGFLVYEEDRFKTTRKGRLVLNALLAFLV